MSELPAEKLRDIGEADYYEARPEGMIVYSWCPTPKPTVPATQVHLHIRLGFGTIVVRFKSPRTLSTLVEALNTHRTDVWPVQSATKVPKEGLERGPRVNDRVHYLGPTLTSGAAGIVTATTDGRTFVRFPGNDADAIVDNLLLQTE